MVQNDILTKYATAPKYDASGKFLKFDNISGLGGKDQQKLDIGTLFEKYFRFWAAYEKITARAAGPVSPAKDREELE